MCGIAGFWDRFRQISNDKLPIIAKQMSDTLFLRGPDDSGVWVDEFAGVALGHRRLAIVDLSASGHQPMHSANKRYVIVFNGEIYNFLELRQELEKLGHQFRGHSDTEVMLASFMAWGVEDAVKRFNGMFAFAVWDIKNQVLYLGRDRIGEKPLYYGFSGRSFIFASELKALKAHPDFQSEINRNALTLFLRYGYIPAPQSIYQGIYKLPPGTLLSWNGQTEQPQITSYWSAIEAAETGIKNPFTGSDTDAVEYLDALLRDAVAMRMVADVPLGAFLSGGVDSSTVVALMQAQSSQPVKTFSIGFYEQRYNEAEYAKAVAQHLGTEHTELYVTPQQALEVIPQIPYIYDEPFSDVSQIPTFLVAQLARQQVTVSLSGDGGDELFAGYKRYLLSRNIWQKVGLLPQKWRHFTANCISDVPSKTWELLPAKVKQVNPGDKLHKLAEILSAPDADTMYADFVSYWKQPEKIVIDGSNVSIANFDDEAWRQLPNFLQRMLYVDTVSYLPDDILVKVDRASMGVSLEGRIPLLDHRVIEFAWRIPVSMKVRNGQGKWLLRQLLYKYVPQTLIERPKMGFSVPINSWLCGPLREWAEELLDTSRLQQQGFLHPQPIRQKWEEHLKGERDWHNELWSVLMFQAWLEKHC